MATLESLESDNLDAVLRGDIEAIYALYQWARRTREGLSEAEFAEYRGVAKAELDDRRTKGLLPQVRAAQRAASPQEVPPPAPAPPVAQPATTATARESEPPKLKGGGVASRA